MRRKILLKPRRQYKGGGVMNSMGGGGDQGQGWGTKYDVGKIHFPN